MRKFYYIRMNPQKVTRDEYNHIVRQYPQPNQFYIDFVYDVEHHEIKELSRDEWNDFLNNVR